MTARIGGLLGLVAGLASVALGQPTPPATGPKPTWEYGHDLRIRKGGTIDYGPDTPKIGVEVFKDEATGGLVAVTQAGNIAVAAVGPAGSEKRAHWLFAHDLRARKADEEKFTQSTTRYGVEVFKDAASGKLLYVSEKATVAFADPPAKPATDKGPAWHHALILKVRGPTEEKFTKDTKKYGVEAFKDENTGGLIYVSETGSIATAPAPAQPPAPNAVKAPTALYGLTLRVRKADEGDFTKDTKKYGVEAFKDENTGGLIYVSETGSIATAPAPADLKPGKGGPQWLHAMTLRARKGGEEKFSKETARFGVEVFEDQNTGYRVYISETGSIAVLPKK